MAKSYNLFRQANRQADYFVTIFPITYLNLLPSFYLEENTDVDTQTVNQLVSVIVFVRVKRIHKIRFITYRSHYADVRSDVHLQADAWRYEQAEALHFF